MKRARSVCVYLLSYCHTLYQYQSLFVLCHKSALGLCPSLGMEATSLLGL